MNKFYGYYESPIGLIEIITDEDAVHEVRFVDKMQPETSQPPILGETIKQLDEYFQGTREIFTVKLNLDGTEFQNKVWQALITIPYGTSMTYKEIAALVGNDKASRAVGGANNKNKISILIPCHRVIGFNKKLVGYRWSIDHKEWLIQHEKRQS